MFASVFSSLWDNRNIVIGLAWASGVVVLSVLRFRGWFKEDAKSCVLQAQDENQMQDLMWDTFKVRRDERVKVLLTEILFWPFYSMWRVGLLVARSIFHPFLKVLDHVQQDAIEQAVLKNRESPQYLPTDDVNLMLARMKYLLDRGNGVKVSRGLRGYFDSLKRGESPEKAMLAVSLFIEEKQEVTKEAK